MEITYYVDLLFLINFSMDFFLLCLLRIILKLKKKRFGLAVGSAAGGFLALIAEYFRLYMLLLGHLQGVLSFLCWLVFVLGISGLMLFLAFSFSCPREFLKAQAGLVFGAALAEGVIQGVISATGWGNKILLLPAGCMGAALLWQAVDKSAWENKFYYRVTLSYQGKKVETKGFLDSGNHLKDPLSGRAVHIAEREIIEKLCPVVEKMRMIPYRTIDGSGKVMPAVFLDRMEAVQEKRRLIYEQPLVAVSPKKLGIKDGCKVLLHE